MSEVPLKPMGKSDIRRLELALIFGTLFRPDVIERIKNAEDRLTWLDSLVVAAAALARERAGYSVSRIADEVGRTESTVRNHLQGKTEAGKLVKETYEMLVKSGGRLEIKPPEELISIGIGAAEAVKKELEGRLKALEEEKRKLEGKVKELEEARKELEEKLRKAEEELKGIKERVEAARKALEEAVKHLSI